jgi:hypothetical protein
MSLTFCKLLKTHIEKMSVFRLSTMLMKTRELNRFLHDVDENKGVRGFRKSALGATPLTQGLFNRLFPRPSPLGVRVGSAPGSAGFWRAPKTAERVDWSVVF